MNSAKMHSNNVHVVQEIPSAKEAGVLNPYTGFPEPLSPDRNTTLTHPDADTSKNATIEAGDLELTRSNSRRRFLHSRHYSQKGITKGRLDPAEYESTQYVDGMKEVNGHQTNGVLKPSEKTNGVVPAINGHATAPVTNGAAKEGESSEEEMMRTEKERDEQGYSEGERKKGVLRKLHLHRA